MRAMESVCAVVGAGAMGHGIGEVLARTQPVVWLYDPDAGALELAVTLVRESLERLERYGLITAQVARETPSRLRTTTDLARAVERAWLVVEAAPEELAVKQELFAELDRLAPADALLATNSSSFTIAQVGARGGHATPAPDRGIALLPAGADRTAGGSVARRRHRRRGGGTRLLPLGAMRQGAGAGAARRSRLHRQPAAAWLWCGKRWRRWPKGWPARKTSTGRCASASDCAFWCAARWLSATSRGLIWPPGFRSTWTTANGWPPAAATCWNWLAAGQLGLKTGRGLLDWQGRDPDEVRRDGDEQLARAAALLGGVDGTARDNAS